MRYLFLSFLGMLCMAFNTRCLADKPSYSHEMEMRGGSNLEPANESVKSLERAVSLLDKVFASFPLDGNMALAYTYNPFQDRASERVSSVWGYTSAIESTNSVLKALQTLNAKGEDAGLYQAHFDRLTKRLYELYENLNFYKGTFEHTSYTRTSTWSVYGVNRSGEKGGAQVAGIENVYDDQQWLVIELLNTFEITGDERFLNEAEYLAEYILDGWDVTLDEKGNELGGIPWGPGYVTKHSCSNGLMISPLVWLHEYYKNKGSEKISRYFISGSGNPDSVKVTKRDYYLEFAKAIYDWQKENLQRADGVYDDMLGGCGECKITYRNVGEKKYRNGNKLTDRIGPAYSYNSGTMLSGAADLYRATNDAYYLKDLKKLSDVSFAYFAKKSPDLKGYYVFDISGYNNWFNNVLFRGYVDAYPYYASAKEYVESFKKNLDFGYKNFLVNGVLPTDLLGGWQEDNPEVNLMFMCSYIAEYANLAIILN